jgi:hypothetical protein
MKKLHPITVAAWLLFLWFGVCLTAMAETNKPTDHERARKICEAKKQQNAPLSVWRKRDGRYMCQAQCQITYDPVLKVWYKAEGEPWECGKRNRRSNNQGLSIMTREDAEDIAVAILGLQKVPDTEQEVYRLESLLVAGGYDYQQLMGVGA